MANTLIISLMVGLGGFIGTLARYGLSLVSQRLAFGWPFGTLAANVLGCFAIGIFTTIFAREATVSPVIRLALVTGFCGGFTTMSSMIYETVEMIRASEYVHATLYAAGSFLLSMIGFFAGVVVVRVLIKICG
jgi:fluoride exporter